MTKFEEILRDNITRCYSRRASAGQAYLDMCLDLKQQLKGKFTTRANKYSWTATRNGLRFEFNYWFNVTPHVNVRKLTSKGGWKKIRRDGNEFKNLYYKFSRTVEYEFKKATNDETPDVAKIMVTMTELADSNEPPEVVRKKRAIITKKSLPDPMPFTDHEGTLEAYRAGPYSRKILSVIESCDVKSIVAIDDTARATEEALIKPGEDPWFYLECSNELGAAFEIISDGEVFHPVNRYGERGGKVTRITKPKKSVDLTKMGVRDKRKVNDAIKEFMKMLDLQSS